MGRAKKRREKKRKQRILIAIILFIIILIGTIIGVIKNKNIKQEEQMYKFYATVIDRTETGVIVSPNKGELVNKKNSILNIELKEGVVDENIQKNDLIKVEYLKEDFNEKADKMIVEKIEEISYDKICELYLTALELSIMEKNEEKINMEDLNFIQIDEMILDSNDEKLKEIIPVYLKRYNKNIMLGNYNDYIKNIENEESSKGYFIVIQKVEKMANDKYNISIKRYTGKDKYIIQKYILQYEQNKWMVK